MIKLAVFCGVASFFAFAGYKGYEAYLSLIEEPALPKLFPDKFWGKIKDQKVEIAINRLIINVRRDIPDEVIKKLNETEFPQALEDDDGWISKYFAPFIKYWKSVYMLKFYEERHLAFNRYPLFLTRIQGLNIDFFHIYPQGVPSHKKVVPLLLLHGWPGYALDFLDLVPHLIKITEDRDFVLELVIPFLPGFGMSDAPKKAGFDVIQMATVLDNLMKRLKLKRYLVHGGDIGADIGNAMATLFPSSVMGYHSTSCVLATPLAAIKTFVAGFWPSVFSTPSFQIGRLLQESGFIHLQATKPDTIGIVLTKNPVGLAFYIIDQILSLSVRKNYNIKDYKLGETYDLDRMLDLVMMTYVSNSIIHSFRFYKTSLESVLLLDKIKTSVPFGCCRFENDVFPQPDWALRDKFSRFVHSSNHPRGSHFPAVSAPDVLALDIIEFIRKVDQIEPLKSNEIE